MTAEPASPTEAASRGQAIAFAVFGLALGVLLIAGKDHLYRIQGGVSNVAELLPFGYAYAAGMVAAFNPCGILLVPSLIAYYLGTNDEEEASWWDRAGRALVFGVIASLGFVILFAAVGLVVVAGGRALGTMFPFGGLAIGLALGLLGVWMLATDRSVGIASASRAMARAKIEGNPLSIFGFGLAYGIASLACTLPVFLIVVGSALTASGPLQALAQFISYATGMGTMLTLVVVAAALFRGLVTRSIRGAMPYMHRIGASMLLGASIFIIQYWLGPSGLLGGR